MRWFLLLICIIPLSACKSLPDVTNVIKPYRIEIQQGNYISQEMLNQLKLGMTREQVRYVLGTPLVTDIFHADRWDYVYYRERTGKAEQRRVSVHFDKDGRLDHIGGDVVPASDGDPAPAPAPAKPVLAPAPAKPAPGENPEPARQSETTPPEEKKERGFFGRILEKIGL